jgi:transcription termination factor Rho
MFFRMAREQIRGGGNVHFTGCVELLPDGYGFLRSPAYSYTSSLEDAYLSPSQIRRLNLKPGDTVEAFVRPPREGERYLAMWQVERINFQPPERALNRKVFEDLTPLHPFKRLFLEHDPSDFDSRLMNLFCPIGKGQRGIISAPPRVGKTILLAKLARAIEANHPEVMLLMLLIDERPEEVTNMRRAIRGEVIASCFDEPAARHAQVTEMVLQKAKRLVEAGRDVVVLVDSITRMGRAFNSLAAANGRIMSGGMDVEALQQPKMFFGAARQIEHGGSLTMLATCLIETGSKMDDMIFEEFKGTGNMEIMMDRRIGDRRIYPAIDVNRSGTRKEELMFDAEELKRVHWLRKQLSDIRDPAEVIEELQRRFRRYKTNAELLMSLKPPSE